jgi:hypothetical protein
MQNVKPTGADITSSSDAQRDKPEPAANAATTTLERGHMQTPDQRNEKISQINNLPDPDVDINDAEDSIEFLAYLEAKDFNPSLHKRQLWPHHSRCLASVQTLHHIKALCGCRPTKQLAIHHRIPENQRASRVQ